MWRVIDLIICEVASWVLVKDKFKFCSLNDMMRDWMACFLDVLGRVDPLALMWSPPQVGLFKVNFDGASFGILGPRLGMVV